MKIAVVGAGVAGLTAARALSGTGHGVTVFDEGSRPGGRLATTALGGEARADYGAQFFTARSDAFKAVVTGWVAEGTVWEWCRGFGPEDGHGRYAARHGMAELGSKLAAGLDVRLSATVQAVRRRGRGWSVYWADSGRGPSRSMGADLVVMTAPVPQSAALLAGEASLPELAYAPTLSLLLALSGPSSVPPPGGAQLPDDPVWSWVGDNKAKQVSTVPSVTMHTRPDVAAIMWPEGDAALTARLMGAASPWLGGAGVAACALKRWLYATPVQPYPERCWVAPGGGLILAGDAFGGPRVEGAFLSGLAAAGVIAEVS